VTTVSKIGFLAGDDEIMAHSVQGVSRRAFADVPVLFRIEIKSRSLVDTETPIYLATASTWQIFPESSAR